MKKINFKELDKTYQEIVLSSIKVRDNAYAPITNFKVGSALINIKGNVFTGCNVESETLTLTSHAESVAIDTMIKSGENNVSAIAVSASHHSPIMPCGICLQKISEFCKDNIEIFSVNLDKKNEIISIYQCKLFDLFEPTFKLKDA